jgi:1-acyl-sn-glycerol-3-phosphate acyltransferase
LSGGPHSTPRAARRRRPEPGPVARRSARLHGFMVAYFGRYFARHMNALRVARWGEPALAPGAGPVVVYSNHPSWWDAAVYVLAGDRLLGSYESYAPIDAEMLRRYGIFGRIGAFGVDLDSARGAADFLAASASILSRPDRGLWLTAQGRFADVRERPLRLKPGIARLPEIAPGATVLPLAIEYAFWLERGAEACIAFGRPIPAGELLALPRPERLARLEEALAATLDRLAADVQSRDPERFRALVAGRAGIGGVYDAWRRLAAALGGRRFDPAHGPSQRGAA